MTHRKYRWLVTTLVIVVVAIGMAGIALAQTPDLPKSTQSNSDKIESGLAAKFAAGPADYIVKFKEQADLSPAYKMGWDERGQFVYDTLRQTADRTQAGAKTILDGVNLKYQTFFAGNELYVWGGNLESAQSLAALPEVELIRETRVYHVDPVVQSGAALQGEDTISSLLKSYDVPVASSVMKEKANAPAVFDWGITDTKADQFWSAFGFQGDGIVVASIDSGVDYTHEALNPNYKCAADPSSPACWVDPGTADCTGPGGGPCDTPYAGIYHGTHTMGTMVAEDDPTLPWQVGMAPNAQWISCLGCPFGGCPDFDLDYCADWMLAPDGDPANRPNIVNNSWGGGGGNSWYQDKVNAWRAAGIFPAFSAGNAYSCNSLGSPGDYQESFGSAAHDVNRNIADFSSKGPSFFGDDPYTKPNLSAPGVDIMSTQPGDSWTAISGTSMASPHTAGAVALLWSCNPGLVGQIDQTFQILQGTTDAAPDGACGAPPDGEGNYTYGYGYLDVYNQGLLWCGDVGTLEGTVTDQSTGDPIALAHVFSTPGPFETSTDGTGFYQMTMMVGDYDITAEAFGYFPQTVAVEIITDTITPQDFALEPAPSSTVDGTVTDSLTGWPLYAYVAIAGYPGGGIWTDPVTGYYSVSLPDGRSYDFTVSAWVPGYLDEDRTVGPLDGDQTEDFALDADQAACTAPGYFFSGGTFEDFSTGSVPPGWSVINNGSSCDWRFDNPAGRPNNTGGSDGFAIADSDYCGPGSYMDTELRSPVLDFSTQSSVILEFKSDYNNLSDVADVDVSNDGGSTWNNVWERTSSDRGPITYSLDISALAGNQPDVMVRFHYYNASWAWWWQVDNVKIGATCNPPADGGLVVGNVYDTNLGMPLTGADVTNDTGGSTTTVATADPNVGDSFYTLFSPSGTHDFTASFPGYTTVTAPVGVVNGGTVLQDFFLPSGYLVVDPTFLHTNVPMGDVQTVPMTLTNLGDGAVNFEIKEKDRGFLPTGRFDVSPFAGEAFSAGPTAKDIPAREAPAAKPWAAGDVIQSWVAADTPQPWGIAFDGNDSTVWVSSPAPSWGGNNTIEEYLPDGTATGASWPYVYGATNGPADAAFNWNTGMIWVAAVGDGDCIHEIDPASGETGNTICPAVPQYAFRGLAYDPNTDTYFGGGWSDQMIYRFDASGTIVESAFVGLAISGLAYNPDTGHLFVMVNNSSNSVSVLDVPNGYANLGSFNVSQDFGPYSGAGMEIDCDGNLWAVDQAVDRVYQFESGETASVCASDVPWLSESPISGTIPGVAPLVNVGNGFRAASASGNGEAVPSRPITLSSPSAPAVYQPVAPANPDAVLWDQPLSVVNQNAYVDQEFSDFPTFSSFLADDFTNTNPWLIDTIFVPGDGWNGFASLLNANALTWQIYADAGGVPAGDPAGGGSPPLWSLTLAPTDPMVTITTGFPGGVPSNATLSLGAPVYLSPGTYWFIFYPTLSFTDYGQYGRQPADTTNGYTGQFINPGGGFGYGTTWQNWTVLGATQQDLAFRLEGTIPAANNQVIDVTFDASVIGQPGDYLADLKVKNDAPYGDLTVPVTMTVEPPPGWGKLQGTVSSLGYCDAENFPLEGAVVVIENSLGVTYTLETDANGYYSWWLDEDYNPYTVSVTYPEHEDGTVTGVIITGGGTTTVDFALRWLKPCVSVDPLSLEATLDFGQVVTQTIDLTNDGAAGTPFEIKEKDRGYTPAMLEAIRKTKGIQQITPRERLDGFVPNAVSTRGVFAEGGTEPFNQVLGQGDVLNQWPTGLALPWGTNYDPDDDTVWFSNPGVAGGDDNDHEYDVDGNATGRLVLAQFGGDWAGDMAYNPNTGMMWQVNVGGDNCIYEVDPSSGMTGNSICGSDWNWTSQRGLAYDPETDTFFIGGWNDTTIYQFDGSGTTLNSWFTGLSISGLAYNSELDLLFIMENSSSDTISVFDVNSGSIIGSFTVSGFGNYVGAGLEIDCDGNLWAANQASGDAYLVDSGYPSSLCVSDVPWLREDPTTGYLDPDTGFQSVDVTFDANYVGQPGEYYASLKVKTDDPVFGTIAVPVTMTVSPPPNYGKLQGTVTSLGYCDANPTPAVEAEVLITSSSGMTWTVMTDDQGYYTWWLDEADSPYTVAVTYPNHEGGEATGVVITGGDTTTVDFDLRWLEPCVSADPTSYDVEVGAGYTLSGILSLFNDGAEMTSFEIKEKDQGMTPPVHIPRFEGELPKSSAPASAGRAPNAAIGAGPTGSIYKMPNGAPAYAFDVYPGGSLVSLDTEVPNLWTVIGPLFDPFVDFFPGGDFLNGDFSTEYAVSFYSNEFMAIDTATADITVIGSSVPNAGETWTGLAGSPDGTLYASAASCGGSSTLYTIDPTNGDVTIVGQITNAPCLIDIAANADGELYGVDLVNDELVKIDPATGEGTVIGSTGFDANYAQGMDFDEDTGILYWAAYGLSGELRIIDTATGASSSVGGFPDGAEVDGLGLATGGAPVNVPWLTEKPVTGTIDADSVADITLTFDSMTYTVGTQLMAMLKVKSDDPVNGTINIPVTMTVAAPAFGVEAVLLDDGLSGRPGDKVIYTLVVTNTSNGPVDSFDIAVSGDEWTTTPAVTETVSLDPGQSDTVEITVDIPADAQGGDFDVVTCAITSQGDPGVSAELDMTTTVAGEYGVEITPPEAAESGLPGEVVIYTLSVMNTGDVTATFGITYTGNTWVVQLSDTSLEIGAGESVELLVSVSIPANAENGDSDGVTVSASGLGGATDSSVLTTTVLIPTRFVYLPLVMNGYNAP